MLEDSILFGSPYFHVYLRLVLCHAWADLRLWIRSLYTEWFSRYKILKQRRCQSRFNATTLWKLKTDGVESTQRVRCLAFFNAYYSVFLCSNSRGLGKAIITIWTPCQVLKSSYSLYTSMYADYCLSGMCTLGEFWKIDNVCDIMM